MAAREKIGNGQWRDPQTGDVFDSENGGKLVRSGRARGRVERGGENVIDGKGTKIQVGPAQPRGRSWSYASLYAQGHRGARSGAAEEADRQRMSAELRARQRVFSREHGMSEGEWNQLEAMKKANQERRDLFVANAKKGVFTENIHLGGQLWDSLAAGKDDKPFTADEATMGRLNKWLGEITGDPTKANGGMGRFGGAYKMSPVMEGLVTYGPDGNPMFDASRITSQGQLNALAQVMKQDQTRQGKYVHDEKQRQAQVAKNNRDFLVNSAYDPDDVAAMSDEQVAAEAGSIRQENIAANAKEFEAGETAGDDLYAAVRHNGGSTADFEKITGKNYLVQPGNMSAAGGQSEYDKTVAANREAELEDQLSQAKPRETSPKLAPATGKTGEEEEDV